MERNVRLRPLAILPLTPTSKRSKTLGKRLCREPRSARYRAERGSLLVSSVDKHGVSGGEVGAKAARTGQTRIELAF